MIEKITEKEIEFTGWGTDLLIFAKKYGYAIDHKYPCKISPVGEIRCRLIKKEKLNDNTNTK